MKPFMSYGERLRDEWGRGEVCLGSGSRPSGLLPVCEHREVLGILRWILGKPSSWQGRLGQMDSGGRGASRAVVGQVPGTLPCPWVAGIAGLRQTLSDVMSGKNRFGIPRLGIPQRFRFTRAGLCKSLRLCQIPQIWSSLWERHQVSLT